MFKEEKPNTFYIEKVDADVVYGTLADGNCGSIDHVFSLKTSVTYLQSEMGMILSGSPGYLTGSPLLVGEKYYAQIDDDGALEDF